MSAINPQLPSVAIFGAQQPASGCFSVTVALDFSASNSYYLDFSNQQNLGRLQLVQTVFIDNSGSDAELTVSCPGTRQKVVAAGRTQGYYALLCPNPVQLTFESTGNSAIIILLTFPIATATWQATK